MTIPSELKTAKKSAIRLWLAVIAALICGALIVFPKALAWQNTNSVVGEQITEANEQSETLLLVTSGLTWAEIDSTNSPELYCFANRYSSALLSLTSSSVQTTKRQGFESLKTGRRAAVLQNNESYQRNLPAEIPQLPGVEIFDLGDLPTRPELKKSALPAIEAKFVEIAGSCLNNTIDESKRIIVASLGQVNPVASQIRSIEATRDVAKLQVPLQLQFYADSKYHRAVLSSGSTRQHGIITNLDLAASLRGEDVFENGRAFNAAAVKAEANQVSYLQQLAASAEISQSQLGKFLTIWALLFVGCLLALLIIRFLERKFLLDWPGAKGLLLGVDTLTTMLVLIPAFALQSQPLATLKLVPEEGLNQILAPLILSIFLALAIMLLSAAIGNRFHSAKVPRALPLALAGFSFVIVVVLDLLLGSGGQLGSFLGTNPLYGARFYGLNNHVAGMLIAYWLLSFAALFLSINLKHRWQVLLVLASGTLLALVAISPAFGADVGSALMFAPATIIAALALTGISWRWWHFGAALLTGILLLVAAGFLDYLRPVGERTHLGMLVASFLEPELNDPLTQVAKQASQTTPGAVMIEIWSLAIDRFINMLQPLWVYPWWLMLPAAAIVLAATILALHRSRVFTELPELYWLRLAGMVAVWLGAVTNDTGLVLLGMAYAVGIIFSLVIWLIRPIE